MGARDMSMTAVDEVHIENSLNSSAGWSYVGKKKKEVIEEIWD